MNINLFRDLPQKEDSSLLRKKIKEVRAKQIQREKQQGKGRPIISCKFHDYRIVAVGNKVFHSKKWQTFHDFLIEYLISVFGSEWGEKELKKDPHEQHPVMQWFGILCRYQKQTVKQPGKVHTAPIIGAVSAYLGLSYNLYLLSHNVELQNRLIQRLKNNNLDQFFGALYETYVASCFIKAGFDIVFEDELDRASKHCEFTATHKKSGRKFSVEAKARMSGKEHPNVVKQLLKALRKEANHERIVFIDVNVPEKTTDTNAQWLNESIANIRKQEATLSIDGNPAPPAYLILTNHPYLYNLETIYSGYGAAGEGFKITDFKVGASFDNLREALNSRAKHQEIYEIFQSIKDHNEIPSTFDGEIPEFLFDESDKPRLIIGHKYIIKDKECNDVVGILTDAVVNESEKKVYGIYKTENGQQLICTCPISDKEVVAYKRHQDTFFGVYKKQTLTVKDPLDLYDFFYNYYRNSPREKLLEFMASHPEFESIKQYDQAELAQLYSECMTYIALNSDKSIQSQEKITEK